MRAGEKTALVVAGVGLMAFMLFALGEPPAPSTSKPLPIPPQPQPIPPPATPPPSGKQPEDTDDETALARMLASETEDFGARVVVGWMAIQTAKRHRKSLYERLTAGKGYGPRVKDGVKRYASTVKAPSTTTRTIAARLLAGELQPSAKIRAFGHSPWVEDLDHSERSAAELLRNQARPADFGGIWARIRGTHWYLYSTKAPVVTWTPGAARAALAKVPVIDPIDPAIA